MSNTNEEEKSKKRLFITIVLLLIVFIIAAFRYGKIRHLSGDETIIYFYNNILEDSFNNKVFTNIDPNSSFGMINVYQRDINIVKDTQIDIFRNEKYKGEKMIAPRSKGSAKFGIKNMANGDLTYDIDFSDESQYSVNMKYKLKMDNIYIVGDKDHYVSIDQMKVNDIAVINGSNNIFTIEWYWEDDDPRDVIVGMAEARQYYTLNLGITAREYSEP